MEDSMDIDHEMEDVTQENLRDESSGGMHRRRSMSHEEERQRRASIKAILADDSITPTERRRSIQHLMDGRRSSTGTNSVASSVSSGASPGDNSAAYDYGYGDGSPTMHRQQNQNGNEYPQTFPNPNGEVCIPVCNENTKRAEQTRPHCVHYERKCTLIAPCCGAAFGCRICHDDSPILPPLIIRKQAARRYHRSSSMPMAGGMMDPQTPEDTHHTIDRFKVKEVICRECYTRQSAKT